MIVTLKNSSLEVAKMAVLDIIDEKPFKDSASVKYAHEFVLIEDILSQQLNNLCLFAWPIFLKFANLFILTQFANFRYYYGIDLANETIKE